MSQENAHLLKQLEGGVNESAEVSRFLFAFITAFELSSAPDRRLESKRQTLVLLKHVVDTLLVHDGSTCVGCLSLCLSILCVIF